MTGNFETPLQVEHIDGRVWLVLQDLVFRRPTGDRVVARREMITDGATIPRVFWPLVGHPAGPVAPAAVLHDCIYCRGLRSRREADRIFLEAMTALGVVRWRRICMWLAVRVFGGGRWLRRK